MEEDISKINPPIFLVSTNIFCWRCGSDMPAVANVDEYLRDIPRV